MNFLIQFCLLLDYICLKLKLCLFWYAKLTHIVRNIHNLISLWLIKLRKLPKQRAIQPECSTTRQTYLTSFLQLYIYWGLTDSGQCSSVRRDVDHTCCVFLGMFEIHLLTSRACFSPSFVILGCRLQCT